MPVNFQMLAPIQGGTPQQGQGNPYGNRIIAQLPEEPSGGGGIGKALSALSGLVGGMAGGAARMGSAPMSGASNWANRPSTQSATTSVARPVTDATQAKLAPIDRASQFGSRPLSGQQNPYMAMASKFLGTNEANGSKALSGFFQQSLGQNIDPKATPWCGAFAGSVLQANGQQIPKNPLAARSYLNFGQPTNEPKLGDIVVLRRGNDNIHGHVGFYNGLDAQGRPTILGGNQSNGVSVKAYDPNSVLGYRTAPPVQEIQSKPSPMIMAKQAAIRAQNDPQYAAKVSQDMGFGNKPFSNPQQEQIPQQAPQFQQISNMSGNISQQANNNPMAGLANSMSQTQQQSTPSSQSNPLGFISKPYESGNRGVNMISSGAGDPGGVSYGSHQLASKTGTMAAYIKQSEKFGPEFRGLQPGTAAFNQKYKELAQTRGDEFDADQKAYLTRTHYSPVRGYANELGLPDSPATNEVLYSMAIQHGGAKKIVANARRMYSGNDEAKIIKSLYEARRAYVKDIPMGAAMKKGVMKRYDMEERDALRYLEQTTGGSSPGQGSGPSMQMTMNDTQPYFQADDPGNPGSGGTQFLPRTNTPVMRPPANFNSNMPQIDGERSAPNSRLAGGGINWDMLTQQMGRSA